MDLAQYTKEEMQWLKKHWGGEFHFLTSYGLKIYNEEDRNEGRLIVRAFMDGEKSNSAGSNATRQTSKVRSILSRISDAQWESH
jgi:hypothetical protein